MTHIRQVDTAEAPRAIGPYSQGTIAKDFIFVSGQLPIDSQTGKMIPGEIKAQTRQVLKNIRAVLSGAGSDLTCVVRCDVFLTDMNNFGAMNEVYAAEFSSNPKPARQCFQVVRLPLDALVEISCIACAKSAF